MLFNINSVTYKKLLLPNESIVQKISKVFANCMSQVGYLYCIFIFSEN